MTLTEYQTMVQQLSQTYDLGVEVEHPAIHEVFEGEIPLFKLLLKQDTAEEPGFVIVSFNLELDIPSAIQWFTRLQQFDMDVKLTASYLKDAQGTSHVGEDAEMLRMYVIEQHVISNWIAANKEEASEDAELEQEPHFEAPANSVDAPKTFTEKKAAQAEFRRMSRKKSGIVH